MTEKKLGRIQKLKYGRGGYQGVMMGITFSLGGDGWGVGDFWGFWGTEINERTQWTEEDRIRRYGETAKKIWELLERAKKDDIRDLEGVPVEVEFEGNALKTWRVLKEVL